MSGHFFFNITRCGKQNKGPENVHVLWSCGYFTLHGKRDFSDVIKVKDFEMRFWITWGMLI